MALEGWVAPVREIDLVPSGVVWFKSHVCGPLKVFPQRAVRFIAALSHTTVPKVEIDLTWVPALPKVLIIGTLTELLDIHPGKVRVASKWILPGTD